MRRMRRIRNVAFLGLLVTLICAGPVSLQADSGGFFCGYGDCTLTFDNCQGTWYYYSYPEQGLSEPGDCLIFYEVALLEGGGGGSTCWVNLDVQGIYTWAVQNEPCSLEGKSGRCFACVQQ